MGNESKIEPWSPTCPSFCFAGFGTDRLRCEQAMKTAERENPNRRPQCVANRADGAASQYRSCSIMWPAKQENFHPAEKCFFLTSPFIELTEHLPINSSLYFPFLVLRALCVSCRNLATPLR